MATETFVVDSTLSPDDAFDKVIDLSRVAEWDRGIKASRLAEGSTGVLGARYDVTVRGFDRELTTVVYELTAVDRPRSFSIVGTHADFRSEDSARVEPVGNRCRVIYEARLVLLGEAPPMDEDGLGEIFAKAVEIARAGLEVFLTPSS